ncbi:hypothetical protein Ataiwa_14020 [Algoriphagus taiwanensis]|uniref:AtpZ/AtpI family protein n=2 Tax=Algoriphagus taiwanensis TaxID=1445656 RepID=A0ABQ6Q0T0_9BACT|nr:hypothetical protein Ataiwa_14020 [Algoriphagus taiwanensis]
MFISGGLLLGVFLGITLSIIKDDFGLWLSVGVGFGMAAGSLSYVIYAAKK